MAHYGDGTLAPDWNYIAEQVVAGLVGMVPEVGSMLSAFVYIYWPEGSDDVWDEVEAQVEALVDEKLAEAVKQAVDNQLDGLRDVLQDYLDALPFAESDPEHVDSMWSAAEVYFRGSKSTFEQTGYQLLLLPQFGQFATMYLALLRDGVVGGASWGWSQGLVDATLETFQRLLGEFTEYVREVYQTALAQAQQQNPGSSAAAWSAVNGFVRQMTLTVLDFCSLWPYFDPVAYPEGVEVILDREIYTDASGTNTDSGPIRLPAAPSGTMQRITVWGWDRIDAVQASYAADQGPGGVTTTPRMGNSGGGSDEPPHGGVFAVGSNPITTASVWSGSIVNALQITFADGAASNTCGGSSGGKRVDWTFPGEVVSSVFVNGVSEYYGSADCIIFGFEYDASVSLFQPSVDALYITAPTESAAEAVAERWSPSAGAKAERSVVQDERAARAAEKGR